MLLLSSLLSLLSLLLIDFLLLDFLLLFRLFLLKFLILLIMFLLQLLILLLVLLLELWIHRGSRARCRRTVLVRRRAAGRSSARGGRPIGCLAGVLGCPAFAGRFV